MTVTPLSAKFDKKQQVRDAIFVAASNSSTPDKNFADYICNGSDDGIQIKAAINAASSGSMWPAQIMDVPSLGAYSSVVKVSETEYHMFYTVLSPVQCVHHATSSDGIVWVDDTANNPIFSPTGAESAVGIANVWVEEGTWYMLYRYTSSAVQYDGLATSSDGIAWTRSGSNPILSLTAGETGPMDPWAIIKVGTTYYLYYNAVLENGGDRYINYATSTNLTTWTKATSNGGYILRNGSFCPSVFKVGTMYYMIVSHYVGVESIGCFTMYQSLSPTFDSKTFIGVIACQSSFGYTTESVDTPWVLCDDVTKTLLPTDPLICYAESKRVGGGNYNVLMRVNTVQEAIDMAGKWGAVKLLPGKYEIGENNVIIDAPITFDASEATLVCSSHVTGKYPVYVASDMVDCKIGVLVSPSANGITIKGNQCKIFARVQSGNVYVSGKNNVVDVSVGEKILSLDGAEECDIRCEGVGGLTGVHIRKRSIKNRIHLNSRGVTTGVKIETGSINNTVDGSIDSATGLLNADATTANNKIANAHISGAKTITDLGSGNLVRDNIGFIAPGEIRTVRGSIATLTQDAFNSLNNPFGQNVALLTLDIYVSTGATATSPNIDCGIGSSATADYTNLFDDLPGETIGLYNSNIATPGAQTQPVLWESGAGNRYLNMSIKDAAATGMVATYVATVMGL